MAYFMDKERYLYKEKKSMKVRSSMDSGMEGVFNIITILP